MELIIIFFLILLNGIFALSEMAFVSSRREKLQGTKSPVSKNIQMILKMMDEPEKLLSSIQVGITVIGIISGMYSGLTLAYDLSFLLHKIEFLSNYAYPLSLFLIVFFVTYLSIVIGELVPKTIALKNPEKIIALFFPFLRAFLLFTYPIVSFLSFSTRLILKIFSIRTTGIGESEDPINEIMGMTRMAVLKNKINHEQANMIANTMKIQNIVIKEIMVKKEEIKALSTDQTLHEALIEAHKHHHTRYPLIISKDFNKIIGYVNFKDIINAIRISPEKPSLKNISRQVVFVNENDKVVDVLKHLIKTFQHIAIVKNHLNIPTGVITLENMLEIIVGDIKDEYDLQPEFLYNITERRFLAGGGISLKKIREVVSLAIPDEPLTLSQWLLNISKSELRIESKIQFENLSFEIRKMTRSIINEVIIDI